jgi:hypothetical protein
VALFAVIATDKWQNLQMVFPNNAYSSSVVGSESLPPAWKAVHLPNGEWKGNSKIWSDLRGEGDVYASCKWSRGATSVGSRTRIRDRMFSWRCGICDFEIAMSVPERYGVAYSPSFPFMFWLSKHRAEQCHVHDPYAVHEYIRIPGQGHLLFSICLVHDGSLTHHQRSLISKTPERMY